MIRASRQRRRRGRSRGASLQACECGAWNRRPDFDGQRPPLQRTRHDGRRPVLQESGFDGRRPALQCGQFPPAAGGVARHVHLRCRQRDRDRPLAPRLQQGRSPRSRAVGSAHLRPGRAADAADEHEARARRPRDVGRQAGAGAVMRGHEHVTRTRLRRHERGQGRPLEITREQQPPARRLDGQHHASRIMPVLMRLSVTDYACPYAAFGVPAPRYLKASSVTAVAATASIPALRPRVAAWASSSRGLLQDSVALNARILRLPRPAVKDYACHFPPFPNPARPDGP